ncbi:MAG: hypothetical protein A2219_01740 [Elusimicrobia bacterium RIFOXYA2_FULL_50_26]|nr:MAG: hypothetical protein A2219_01740 [Elusimicrobia bacterium RIFOXYA2_FULL_50_26]OGS24132.1 MAG: hypothetical protein A2314_09460 [Elusimicrobia bacterium RIFOXYB2_FULL_50_12]
MVTIPPKILLNLYRVMLTIRNLQNKIEEEYPKDGMKTPVHLYTGQEAIAAGFCAHLNSDDYLFSNYRGHGHYIAKGGNLAALVAELYGRESGCSRGRGGSMHLVDTSAGLMGASSIVAGNIPIAAGAALAFKMMREKRVSVVFFGDGAVDEGVLYESVNFAVLKKLPVIFACENNFYAVCSPQRARQRLDNIYRRLSGCGIPGTRIGGNDVAAVYLKTKNIIAGVRGGKGPALIEFRTYRWCGHAGGGSDVSLGYRTQQELDRWKRKCPLLSLERRLMRERILTPEQKLKIHNHVNAEIEQAFASAITSPYPDAGQLSKYVFREK